jgi:predicted GNAT family acetyltransferase
MIEQLLDSKYGEYLVGLDIYENRTSLKLSRIVIKPEYRNTGVGTKIMEDLVKYADQNTKTISLTPASDFGGNKNRLLQFYKRFGFKHNKGQYKSYEVMDTMIRYPKLMESKTLIKSLLREFIHKENSHAHACADFVNFAKGFLGIEDAVKVVLKFERTPDLVTTAYYDPEKHLVVVYAKNRALVDVCRSIAHELVHHRQNLDDRLLDIVKDGSDGSPIENEANSIAGVMMRQYGRLHPEIYES